MTLFDKSNAIASILERHKAINILDDITDMEIYNQDFKIYFLVAKTMLGLNNELPEILCFSIEDGDDVVYFDLFVVIKTKIMIQSLSRQKLKAI